MASNNTSANLIVKEPINDNYEWIWYNSQLRIIHSIKDDMYQMQSIISACDSNKQARHWFDNDSTKELLREFLLEMNTAEFRGIQKPFEKRPNLAPAIKGYYIHRLLVNAVAMWASPRYSLRIFRLLDEMARNEREELENRFNEKIQEQKPRLVPEKKERSYKYMIWTEEMPEDPDMINLHLVRRNNKTFYVVQHIRNSDKCWFFREQLPVAMTPNEDIKALVKNVLPKSEYDIDGCTILTYKEHLPLLHERITEYFDSFQD